MGLQYCTHLHQFVLISEECDKSKVKSRKTMFWNLTTVWGQKRNDFNKLSLCFFFGLTIKRLLNLNHIDNDTRDKLLNSVTNYWSWLL
jgi:hypothetical protein